MIEIIKGLEFGEKLVFLFLGMAALGLIQLWLRRSGSKRKIRFTPFAVILAFVVVYLSTSGGASFATAIVEGFMFLCAAISVAEFCANPNNFPSDDE